MEREKQQRYDDMHVALIIICWLLVL